MKRLLFILFLLPFPVFALSIPQAPVQYIQDEAQILSPEFELQMIEKLTALEETTTAEIAVLTIATLEDDDLEGYANKVFREWGIGQEESDNGLLILIVSDDHKARIEVGYGLEGRVTDANAIAILNTLMVPSFKEGDFETGIKLGVDELSRAIQAEADEYGFAMNENSDAGSVRVIIIAIILLSIFFTLYAVYEARTSNSSSVKKKVVKKVDKKWWQGDGTSSEDDHDDSGSDSGFGGGSSGGGGASSSW